MSADGEQLLHNYLAHCSVVLRKRDVSVFLYEPWTSYALMWFEAHPRMHLVISSITREYGAGPGEEGVVLCHESGCQTWSRKRRFRGRARGVLGVVLARLGALKRTPGRVYLADERGGDKRGTFGVLTNVRALIELARNAESVRPFVSQPIIAPWQEAGQYWSPLHHFTTVAGSRPDIPGFLLQPFRKPKRIRTAFSPSQLLKLEHAFEKNHYVVGAERKQLAQSLSLTETQDQIIGVMEHGGGRGRRGDNWRLLSRICLVKAPPLTPLVSSPPRLHPTHPQGPALRKLSVGTVSGLRLGGK
ncbi:unnamed protein product [Bemisia tabaci]|uniref:Homeobox domain-containing protein n=1 Tax=Bemisia tabaci TaxID=7038 RepID=A0A9P0F7M7_BEMTA|nr:unnamed protein product [Bemisia tabaci]